MTQVLDWTSIAALVPLIGALPDRCREGIALRHVTKGETIFRRGDKPRSMLAVLSGEVRLVRSSPRGGEIIFQRARCGLLAEASLDQPRYHCDAVAAEGSDLVTVPRNAFRDALTVDEFRNKWTTHLLQELRRVRAHAERISLHTARERIIHYIEAEGENGSVRLTQSKKDWAGELALTHEALYRALAKMEANGELTIDQSELMLRARPLNSRG